MNDRDNDEFLERTKAFKWTANNPVSNHKASSTTECKINEIHILNSHSISMYQTTETSTRSTFSPCRHATRGNITYAVSLKVK
jgi:hypothetical protein